MHRIAAFLLGLVVAAFAAGTACAQERSQPRRSIMLFVVKVSDENARKGVDEWIKMFMHSIRFLLLDSSSGGSDANSGIRVVITKTDVDVIDDDMVEESFDKQPSLQVLRTIGAHAGNATLVNNQVYLGDLKGSLPIPYLQISQRVDPSQYRISRDALAAVSLYAYAMAIAKTFPAESNRFVVCQVLDRANMYRNADLDSEARVNLDRLFRAISTELEARACGGRR